METRREKRSGCVVALMILTGLAVTAIVIAAVVVYLYLQTDEGRRFYESFSDSASLTLKATQGPGNQALRGIGCETPMVLTVGEWTRLESSIADLAKETAEVTVADEARDVPLVQCYGTHGIDALPSCDDLAAAYVSAIESPPARFIVLAHNKSEGDEANQIACTGYYAASGARIGDLGENFTFIPAQ